jgi:hypothetical protein
LRVRRFRGDGFVFRHLEQVYICFTLFLILIG